MCSVLTVGRTESHAEILPIWSEFYDDYHARLACPNPVSMGLVQQVPAEIDVAPQGIDGFL